MGKARAPLAVTMSGPPVRGRAPIRVAISNDPEVRIRQSMSFWRRNPGYFKTFTLFDTMRGVLELIPFGKTLNHWFAPTEYGHGQPMVDQMRWQIRSRRQPDNEWWMTVNSRLVGAGLVAEAYLRAGRANELKGPQYDAWLSYLIYSDMSRRKLKLLVGERYTTPGKVDDLSRPEKSAALSDAYKGASILDRLEVQFIYKPLARKAYWVAHDKSIQAGKGESQSILREQMKVMPGEAAFGSAWANTIKLFSWLAPPAAGHFAIWMQNTLLPQRQPVDTGKPTWLQGAFVKFIGLFDKSLPAAPADAVRGVAALAPAAASAPSRGKTRARRTVAA